MHSTTGSNDTAEYDRLLARQDAMLLRRSMLSTGSASTHRPHRTDAFADLTAEQALIRASLPLVGPLDALIDDLYAHLFRRGPYLRALFPASLDFQRHRLGAMFERLVDGLDRPEPLVTVCRELGREHRKLGVRPVHYQQFDAALREALRERAGAAWTEPLDAAWAGYAPPDGHRHGRGRPAGRRRTALLESHGGRTRATPRRHGRALGATTRALPLPGG